MRPLVYHLPMWHLASSPRFLHTSSGVMRGTHERRKLAEERIENQQDGGILRVAIDCSFNRHYQMSRKELSSLARQIRDCFGANIRSLNPCKLHLVGLEEGGDLDNALRYHFTGYPPSKLLMEISSRPVYEVFDHKELIYLSPYSKSALQELKRSMVYVMGGVVDSRCTKMLTENIAKGMELPTARLPIKEHLIPIAGGNPGKLDLPINQVMMMMLSVYGDGNWTKALYDNMAKRKQWIPKEHTVHLS